MTLIILYFLSLLYIIITDFIFTNGQLIVEYCVTNYSFLLVIYYCLCL